MYIHPNKMGCRNEKNRHLLEVTRVLLFQNNVPKSFWPETVLTATYLINRLSSAKLNFKSPLEFFLPRKNQYWAFKNMWMYVLRT
jgi:hypothetical protein